MSNCRQNEDSMPILIVGRVPGINRPACIVQLAGSLIRIKRCYSALNVVIDVFMVFGQPTLQKEAFVSKHQSTARKTALKQPHTLGVVYVQFS
jgi:hypothetical protein